LGELRRMAVYNTRQALGDEAGTALDRSLPHPDDLDGKVRRICTDNRLHAWEWLVCGDRIIKADALDHSAAHDLIGHQDVGWDIAGAIVELSLSEEEASRLFTIVEREGAHPVSPELLTFLLPCYCAFHMGAHLMAAAALEGEEGARLRKAAERYGHLLRRDET
jgi:hypothetical protein